MIDFEEFERRLQRPVTPKRVDEDPLAELARLVGSTEDPYRGVFEVPAAASRAAPGAEHAWDAAFVPPKNHPLAGDFAAIEAGLLRGALPEPQDWQHAPQAYAPQAAYASDAYAAPVAERDAYAAPVAERDAWPEPAAEAPRSRKPLVITAAVIVFGLVGIGASFALKGRVGGSREVATINAMPGPTKIQPTTQDGVNVPNQDATILDRSTRPNAVALSNNREQPIDLARLPERAPKVLSVGNAPLTGAALSDQQAASAPTTPTPAQPTSIASLIEPRKVRTVSVRPDGTVLPNEAAPNAQAATPRPAATDATPVAKPTTPKSTARVVTTPKPALTPTAESSAPIQLAGGAKPKPGAPAAKPTTRAALAPPAADEDDDAPAPAAASGGGFAVQLAAPGSANDAKDAISKFSARYASELGGRRPSMVKATVGSRDVYRVRVVNLSRDDATTLCEKLKVGGGSCFVAKN